MSSKVDVQEILSLLQRRGETSEQAVAAEPVIKRLVALADERLMPEWSKTLITDPTAGRERPDEVEGVLKTLNAANDGAVIRLIEQLRPQPTANTVRQTTTVTDNVAGGNMHINISNHGLGKH